MAGYADCLRKLAQAAGRTLTDKEIHAIYSRVEQAARDVRAGRVEGSDITAPKRAVKSMGVDQGEANLLVQEAAQRAAADLEREAALAERQANLQLVRLGSRQADVERMTQTGTKPMDAVERTLARDYSGRVNVVSLEQSVEGYKSYFSRRLTETWEALGSDYLGFFQDRTKLLDLIRELRGTDSGNPLAKRGAKAFHEVAEEARQVFNANGGDIGRLDDWGMPQHHSQERVAAAGKDAWVDQILPWLDRAKYVDDVGQPMGDAEVREFLSHAWDTIATNGIANITPGKSMGIGKRANRHGEHRQIHFRDAESYITYWEAFGERTALEILLGHTETMARDIAFIEHYGPNPNITYRTLRDAALQQAAMAEPTKTPDHEGRAVKLDGLYDYAAGRMKPTYNRTVRYTADAIAHLNVAGKLGGAALASLFGDKPMMEAVSHMNDLPMLTRWQTEMRLLNPTKGADRRALQRQGLMLDSVRSGLQRFYEGLGQTGITGRLANAVMRITGMQAINDIRKGAFGLNLMSAIGAELQAGRTFDRLPESDVRTLRNYGISKAEWDTWRLAQLETLAGAEHVLTPEAIARITDEELRAANVVSQAGPPQEAIDARRTAIVKLLAAVNTESEFAIVTPGWRERATFYGDLQRGTVKGEIARSVLQFKAFPWAMLQRGMDAVANQDSATSKAAMTAYLMFATTLAGAMLMQTREMLAGKDPRSMVGKPTDLMKFWGAAFLQGGALGIYGDFLYSVNQTRYGSGPVEALAGPTIGPLLELGLVLPLNNAKKALEGKDTHLGAELVSRAKGFVPGNNIWYAKAAIEHLFWQRVMDALSPGYLNTIRQKTAKEYGQDWWWRPGETTPERAPDLGRAVAPR
jgi:hypothetical protein